jgi:hypothetical protein
MSNAENAVRVAQAALQAAIINARGEGYRVKWQINGDGEHSVVVDGGPEPANIAPVAEKKPEPIATFGGGRRFAMPVSPPAEDPPVKDE